MNSDILWPEKQSGVYIYRRQYFENMLFMQSFIQPTFTEHPLCTSHCVRPSEGCKNEMG